MKSKIILFITIVLTFMLQTTLVQRISIGSIEPNLVLIFVACTGILRGRKSGMWVGFFSGLLIDMFYGSLFGFYALIYVYIGFFSGYSHRMFYDDDAKVYLLTVFGSDMLFNFAVYGLQFLLRGRLSLGSYLVHIIIPEVFYTTFLTLIVYRIFYFINYHLMKPVKKESESVWVIK